MPAVSEAQRRYLYKTKGPLWAKRHGFDNKGKLPDHITPAPQRKKLAKVARRRALKRP